MSFTGATGALREQGADDRRVVVARFAAEPAADFGLDDAHLRLPGTPERGGVAAAREKRRLRVAPHRHAAARPARDAADRLERGVPLARAFPRAFDGDVARAKAGVDVAALEVEVMRDVADGVVVNERRAGRERCVERKHGRQHFVLDDDPVDRGARDRRIGRGYGGDFVADIAHACSIASGYRSGRKAPHLRRGVSSPSEHRFDARHRRGGARVDRHDARVRVRAAQHRSVQHAGQVDVGDVLRRAGDFRNRVGARNVAADDEEALRVRAVGSRWFMRRLAASRTAS